MIVGQRDEAGAVDLSIALCPWPRSIPWGGALILLKRQSARTPHREFLERIVQAIPHPSPW